MVKENGRFMKLVYILRQLKLVPDLKEVLGFSIVSYKLDQHLALEAVLRLEDTLTVVDLE
jgi:hypothetical protein